MCARLPFLVCIAVVGLATFVTIEPRFHHQFPSMVDDWAAISRAPDQLREILVLGNPEPLRYRPGFIAWNALQWHTLGAPTAFLGPQLWNLVRVALLVVGITALAAILIPRDTRIARTVDPRWILVAGAGLAVLTTPRLAVDLARFGPQEPLQVGGLALGAALLVRSLDRLLDPSPLKAGVYISTLAGLGLWSFGVLQKETSCCLLVLAPFLLPTINGQRDRWRMLADRRKRLLGAVGAAILLPFVPMIAWTVRLALADERVYEDYAANRSLATRIWDQLSNADDILESPLFWILTVASLAVVALAARRTDYLAIGLVFCALAFVVFAAETGVAASRYYLPTLTLLAIAVARTSVAVGLRVVVVTGLALLMAGTWQARDARRLVGSWVENERDQESLVRMAAAIGAGGCAVDVTGRDVELVEALPVLVPLTDESARVCRSGQRFIVVIDGYTGSQTPLDDPTLARCAPEPRPIWSSEIAVISRCTA